MQIHELWTTACSILLHVAKWRLCCQSPAVLLLKSTDQINLGPEKYVPWVQHSSATLFLDAAFTTSKSPFILEAACGQPDLSPSRSRHISTFATSHHFPPLQSQGDGHCSDTLGDLRFEMAPTQELGHLRTAWKTGGTLRRASAPPLYVLPREGKDTVQQTTAMTRVGHWELIVMLWDPRSPPTETVYHLPPGSHFPAAKRR